MAIEKFMKLAVGPLLFYWQKQEIIDFYLKIESMPVEVVYLGEVVCANRHEMCLDDWLSLAKRLMDAGKEVILSTQCLLESQADLNKVRKIVNNGFCLVEANDHGAVMLLSEHQIPFVAGMHLNIYNASTLRYFKNLGCFRWVPPIEMEKAALEKVLADKSTNMQTEVFAYGKMPLAFSARCFTARHYGLNKDNCQFKCQQYPDGLLLSTQENQAFLSINGVQIQSAQSVNLISYLDDMKKTGVHILRLSPQYQRFDEIVRAFDQTRRGESITMNWKDFNSSGHCDGYWLGKPGLQLTENLL